MYNVIFLRQAKLTDGGLPQTSLLSPMCPNGSIISRSYTKILVHRAQRILGSETILYDTMMVDTDHYTFVKTYRMYNVKSEFQCKLWTWVTVSV